MMLLTFNSCKSTSSSHSNNVSPSIPSAMKFCWCFFSPIRSRRFKIWMCVWFSAWCIPMQCYHSQRYEHIIYNRVLAVTKPNCDLIATQVLIMCYRHRLHAKALNFHVQCMHVHRVWKIYWRADEHNHASSTWRVDNTELYSPIHIIALYEDSKIMTFK